MNPLQDLKDIRTPAAIENWPPAYGWWILGLLVVISLCLVTIWLLKVRKLSLAKRQALKALQQIDSSQLDSVPHLNQLLKRVAMVYFPDQNVQKMHSEKWAAFLVNSLPKNKARDFSASIESMQQTLYQVHKTENPEFPRYRQAVETWIKHALPPRKNRQQKLEQKHA